MSLLGGFFLNASFLVYNYNIKDQSTGKFWLLFDSIISVSNESEVEVPTKPLENGRFGTDSKYRKPETIRVKGVINNIAYINIAINKLESALKSDQLFIINTLFKSYKNYTLSSKRYEFNKTNAFSLVVDLEFTEILIVQTQEVSFKQVKSQNKATNVSKIEKGRTEIETNGTKKSILKSIGNKISGKSEKVIYPLPIDGIKTQAVDTSLDLSKKFSLFNFKKK